MSHKRAETVNNEVDVDRGLSRVILSDTREPAGVFDTNADK